MAGVLAEDGSEYESSPRLMNVEFPSEQAPVLACQEAHWTGEQKYSR